MLPFRHERSPIHDDGTLDRTVDRAFRPLRLLEREDPPTDRTFVEERGSFRDANGAIEEDIRIDRRTERGLSNEILLLDELEPYDREEKPSLRSAIRWFGTLIPGVEEAILSVEREIRRLREAIQVDRVEILSFLSIELSDRFVLVEIRDEIPLDRNPVASFGALIVSKRDAIASFRWQIVSIRLSIAPLRDEIVSIRLSIAPLRDEIVSIRLSIVGFREEIRRDRNAIRSFLEEIQPFLAPKRPISRPIPSFGRAIGPFGRQLGEN